MACMVLCQSSTEYEKLHFHPPRKIMYGVRFWLTNARHASGVGIPSHGVSPLGVLRRGSNAATSENSDRASTAVQRQRTKAEISLIRGALSHSGGIAKLTLFSGVETGTRTDGWRQSQLSRTRDAQNLPPSFCKTVEHPTQGVDQARTVTTCGEYREAIMYPVVRFGFEWHLESPFARRSSGAQISHGPETLIVDTQLVVVGQIGPSALSGLHGTLSDSSHSAPTDSKLET
ncbi:hypothetical protein QBC37DRAFT_395008 [Rhypophila decipiens]|uniref:Uncharacterized protein n=1 Tax=Rhypophila decipiens TaxID=261697 RepID=A0AAN7BCT9_9PEZI|nr:hypothetical protein QBC37DRAFT_395008 [Rhypophila decipiens]